MKVVHLSDHIGARAHAGGAEVICANIMAVGRLLGAQQEAITLDDVGRGYGFQILEHLEDLAPDLVHVHNAYGLLTHSVTERLVERFATLFTIYDVRPICPTTLKFLPDGGNCAEPLSVRCVRRGCPTSTAWGAPTAGRFGVGTVQHLTNRLGTLRRSHLALLSPYLHKQFRNNGFLDDDLTVVMPPLAVEVASAPKHLPEEAGRDRPFKLLFVGRLDRDKGLYFLAEALERLRSLPWTLEVVGDSPGRAEVEQDFASRDLTGEVIFRGFQPPDRLVELYDDADCLLVPSLIAETFCQVLGEAMARGLPTLSLGAGAIPDWVQHGETGWVVGRAEPAGFADAIETVLGEPALADRLAAGGWRWVQEHLTEPAIRTQLETAWKRATRRFSERRSEVLPVIRDDAEANRPPLVESLGGTRILAIGRSLPSLLAAFAGTLAQAVGKGASPRFVLERRLGEEEEARLAQGLGNQAITLLDEDGGVGLDHPRLASVVAHFAPDRVLVGPDLLDGSETDLLERLGLAGGPEAPVAWCGENQRPLAADQVLDISEHAERKRHLLILFDHPDVEAVLALDAYRSSISCGLGGGFGEAMRRLDAAEHEPGIAGPLPTRSLAGSRLLVLGDSPSAPTASGKLLRRLLLPLAREQDLDLVVLAPHLWPEDAGAGVRLVQSRGVERDLQLLVAHEIDAVVRLDGRGRGDAPKLVSELRRHRPLWPILELGKTSSFLGIDPRDCFRYSHEERSEARRDVLPAHASTGGSLTLLAVAGNQAREHLPALLQLLHELIARGLEVYLHVHTHPFEGDHDLLAVARGLGLSSRHLGFSFQPIDRRGAPIRDERIDDADLTDLYNSADVFLSLGTEGGHHLAVLEAMACGLPVVASATEHCREWLVEERGVTVPPSGSSVVSIGQTRAQRLPDLAAFADAVEALASDPGRRLEMADKAEAWAQERTWGEARRKLVHWLEAALRSDEETRGVA